MRTLFHRIPRRLRRAIRSVLPLTPDALAGLPNRAQALALLDEACDAARRSTGMAAVIVLDIDGFRRINSHYGWQEGEQVLRECVARLSGRLGARDTHPRQGGNEIIVMQKLSLIKK